MALEAVHPTAKRVLLTIYEYQEANGNWYPTIRDLIHDGGFSSNSVVSAHLKNLKKCGYIDMRKERPSCRITEKGLRYLQAIGFISIHSQMPSIL
jgi:Mn-dependent DtxR family transcriptional regulator